MFSKQSKFHMNYLSAIFLGSVTGVIGVALLLLFLLVPNDRKDEAVQPVTNPIIAPVQNQQQFYAVQHGVFSSVEAAEQFKSSYATLNVSSLITHNAQTYTWSAITTEKTDLSSAQPSAFYKQVLLASSCDNYPQLIETYKTLDENIFMNKNEISSKIPNEWLQALEKITTLSSNPNVWRVLLLEEDLKSSKCLKINF